MKYRSTLLAIGLSLLAPTAALAQPPTTPPSDGGPAPAGPAADDAAAPAEVPASAPADDEGLGLDEGTVLRAPAGTRRDVFWAHNRGIRVIQKRPFRKERRHEFTLFAGTVPNDDFFAYLPVGGRWNYFFAEDFSAEVWGTYQATLQTSLKGFIESNTNGSLLVEIPQTLTWMAGADVTWSPVHGKFSAAEDALGTLDAHVAFGAGVIGTTVTDSQSKATNSKFDVSGNLGLGVRLYLTRSLSIRMDYRQYFYPAETGGLAYPAELTLGVSLWTAAPE